VTSTRAHRNPAQRIQKAVFTSHVSRTIITFRLLSGRKVDYDTAFIRHESVTGEFVKFHGAVLSLAVTMLRDSIVN